MEKPLELVESYTCYELNKEAPNKDTIPKWIENVMKPQQSTKPITDVTGIWP